MLQKIEGEDVVSHLRDENPPILSASAYSTSIWVPYWKIRGFSGNGVWIQQSL